MVMLDDELVNRSYGASLAVLMKVVPYLPEDDEVGAKLMHRAKAIPQLIASCGGDHVSLHHKQRALGEAVQFCREAIVQLSYCRDLHGRFINGALLAELMKTYRSVGDDLSRAIVKPADEEGVS